MSAELWRLEQGALPGCPVGTIVSTTREGGRIRISQPAGGVVADLPASNFILSVTDEGYLALVNRTTWATLTFSPYGSGLGSSASEGLVAGDPATVVRTYRGKQQADTTMAFRTEAAELAKFGYLPTTQSWAQGQWGGGAFLAALLLCIFLIGIVIFIFLLVVKPEGTLTVTYARSAAARAVPVAPETPEPAPPPQASASLTLTERLEQLGEARSAGLLTAEEYDAKRREVLEQL